MILRLRTPRTEFFCLDMSCWKFGIHFTQRYDHLVGGHGLCTRQEQESSVRLNLSEINWTFEFYLMNSERASYVELHPMPKFYFVSNL